MTKKNGVKLPQAHEGQGQLVIPPIKVGPLNKQGGVRRMHARIIKAALKGELPVEEMARFSNSLMIQSKVIEAETLEDRLDRIEQAMGVRK